MATSVPPRSKVDKKYTWNSESVFASQKEWEAAMQNIPIDALNIKNNYEGRISESAEVLVEALDRMEDLMKRVLHVFMYAGFSYNVDVADQNTTAMYGRAQAAYGRAAETVSFINSELIQIGKAKLDEWIAQNPKLATQAHTIEELFRKQEHVRSAEVEELLAVVADPLSGAAQSVGMLTKVDFKFAPAKDFKSKKIEVTQDNFQTELMEHPDRKVRQSAFESYMDKHIEFKNTLAANLITSIKTNIFYSQARNHEDSLSAALFENNVPSEVYYGLIDAFKNNFSIWQRYFEVRRKALKLKEITYYDMWAPIAKTKTEIPYETAVEHICDSLAPLGAEYVETVRQGCLTNRWVDVYPNQGKQNGSFSWGAPGAHPFIMMSYADDVKSMSTLAHELGHSMHSQLTWQNQPLAYANCPLLTTEVASNFNQVMLRDHLLKTVKDENFLIALIEEAISGNFFRYFFQMPTLARFELETHQRIEHKETLTANSMQRLMAELFAEGFGPKVNMDWLRIGMVWATFPHLFSDYYVYQYAAGIAGAHAFSGIILRGEPNSVEDYLNFLKSGSSVYPIDALKRAGVNLTIPKAANMTFTVMNSYIDRLEELTS